MSAETDAMAGTVAQLAEIPAKLEKEREYTGVLLCGIVILAAIGVYCLFRRKHGRK